MEVQQVLEKGDEAYRLFQEFELARYRVYCHCGIIDPSHIPTAPGTRRSDAIYTTRIDSDCQHGCQNRHVELSRSCYLVYYAALPFQCEHGAAIRGLYVETSEDRTLPLLVLSPQIRRMEPAAVSEAGEGLREDDVLEADIASIRQAQQAAAAAFLEVGALVLRERFDTSIYPQLGTQHTTQLSVTMSHNFKACLAMVGDFKAARRRQL